MSMKAWFPVSGSCCLSSIGDPCDILVPRKRPPDCVLLCSDAFSGLASGSASRRGLRRASAPCPRPLVQRFPVSLLVFFYLSLLHQPKKIQQDRVGACGEAHTVFAILCTVKSDIAVL